MTVEEAFRIIENLDYQEGLRRRFAPQYSLIQIGRAGEVLSVERFKEPTTEEQKLELFKRFPHSFQISGLPGLYASADELRVRIVSAATLLATMRRQN